MTFAAPVLAQDNAPGEEAAVVSTAPAIRVVEAEKRELVETLTVNGSVHPREEASVGTDLNGLIVLELYADTGDHVKKGDVLARLDRTSLETQKAQIVASRAQAEATVAQADSQIADAQIGVNQAEEAKERAKTLLAKKVGTKTQADNARYAFESAQAKLEVARKAKASAEAQLGVIDAQERDIDQRLEKTEVKAPADGFILSRNAALGGVVMMQGGPLFRIAIDSELELVADVPETTLPQLTAGMNADIYLPGLAQPLSGKIRMIAPEVDARTRLGKVHVTLPWDEHVRAGNFARGTIELGRSTGVAVPQSALVFRGETALLQTVKDGVIVTREVKTGIRENGYVEIVSGVEAGETVVERAGTFVTDGDRVNPIAAEPVGASQ